MIFLDRAIGSYFPYVLDDIPALQEQMQGFVYYPNTVSLGSNTLLGGPALMGGYEYSPEETNKRPDQSLASKHNESMLLLPRLFYEAGYEVTVSDPPWPNHKWSGDFTPFDPYPEMDVFAIEGKYTNRYLREHLGELSEEDISSQINTSLPRFSLFRIAYPFLRTRLYDQGRYFSILDNDNAMLPFLDKYAPLYYLPELTDYEAEGNTYTFIDNETPHRPIYLELPSFEPKIEATGSTAPIGTEQQLSEFDVKTYQVNAVSMKRIGLWLEKLQQDDMYDNTRIVIVADHGYGVFNPLFAGFDDNSGAYGYFNPLLLVKDFNARGPVVTDNTFMTHADAPLFALKDLAVSPINPFTGKNVFEQVKKDTVNVYQGEWDPKDHPANIFEFFYHSCYTVKDDITVESNWIPLKK